MATARRFVAAVACMAALAIAACDLHNGDDRSRNEHHDGNRDRHPIEGKWRLTGFEHNHTPSPLPEGFAATMEFRGGEFTYETSTGDYDAGTYVIDERVVDERGKTLVLSYTTDDGQPSDHVEVLRYRIGGNRLFLTYDTQPLVLTMERTG